MMHSIGNLFKCKWMMTVLTLGLALAGMGDMPTTPWDERVVEKVAFDPSWQFWCLGAFAVVGVLGLTVWIGRRKKARIARWIVLELIGALALALLAFWGSGRVTYPVVRVYHHDGHHCSRCGTPLEYHYGRYCPKCDRDRRPHHGRNVRYNEKLSEKFLDKK